MGFHALPETEHELATVWEVLEIQGTKPPGGTTIQGGAFDGSPLTETGTVAIIDREGDDKWADWRPVTTQVMSNPTITVAATVAA